MDSTIQLAVVYDSPVNVSDAQKLARQLSLPLIEKNQESINAFHYVLAYTPLGLQLDKVGDNSLGPLRVDLYNPGLTFRQQHNLNQELLSKALGIRGEHNPIVWDMTAGLGQDSMILASIGCQVHSFERNPIIYALLNDGLQRARDSEGDAATSRVIELHYRNSIEALSDSNLPQPDIIYIDPMFPEKKKNAKAKKAMQYCQQIVGKDDDAERLLSAALLRARYRVVVKRSRSAPCLSQQNPSNQILGKTVRYDIYALRSVSRYLEEKNAMTR